MASIIAHIIYIVPLCLVSVLPMALTPEFSLKAGTVVQADTVSPLGEEPLKGSAMDASRSPYVRGPQEGAG